MRQHDHREAFVSSVCTLSGSLGDDWGSRSVTRHPLRCGPGRGPAGRIIPGRRELRERRTVLSVQLARLPHGSVLMVRRRSTVRFRNGAPGHGHFSDHSNERRGTSPGDALQLPLHSESSHRTASARRQLRKIAVGRPSRDSLLTVRARSPWAGRPAAGRFQASMRRIKIQSPPGGCWCRLARQAGVMRGWITATSLGWAGDERGQDADPPVHAVWVRDVLQLNVLRALLRALRTCR